MKKTILHTLIERLKPQAKYIALAVAVIITAGAVIYYSLFYVSKADYGHMLSQVNHTITSYNDLSVAREAAVNGVKSTDDTFKELLSSYLQAHSAYHSDVDALANERALRTVEVSKAYDALNQKDTQFDQYVERQLKVLALVHAVAVSCTDDTLTKLNISDLSKVVEVYDSATTDCVNSTKALVDSGDAAVVARGKPIVDYFAGMRKHAVAMQDAYGAANRTTFESEYNAFLDDVALYKTKIIIVDLLSVDKKSVPTDELNSLANTISRLQK